MLAGKGRRNKGRHLTAKRNALRAPFGLVNCVSRSGATLLFIAEALPSVGRLYVSRVPGDSVGTPRGSSCLPKEVEEVFHDGRGREGFGLSSLR